MLRYICPNGESGSFCVKGTPASVADIISVEIGILPRRGTPKRSLSFFSAACFKEIHFKSEFTRTVHFYIFTINGYG